MICLIEYLRFNGPGLQAYQRIIGWMMRIARSVTTARAYSRPGAGSIIVEFAVSIHK